MVLALSLVLLALPVGTALADTIRCNFRGNEVCHGTDGADVMRIAGDLFYLRILKAHGGDDVVWGEKDGEWIPRAGIQVHGDAGDDELHSGNDPTYKLLGGYGKDRLYADYGHRAEMHGEQGDDLAVGNAGNDFMTGNRGRDELRGRGGDDLVRGEDDRDTLSGEEGRDNLHGGDGNDSLRAGEGDDIAHGGDDVDRLDGGEGSDELFGGRGDDEIDAAAPDHGRDKVFGYPGDDEIRARDGRRDVIDCGDGRDTVYYDEEADEVDDSCEELHPGR